MHFLPNKPILVLTGVAHSLSSSFEEEEEEEEIHYVHTASKGL